MTQSQIEQAIDRAYKAMIDRDSTLETRRKAAAEMKRLNGLRSPSRVRKMEIEQGLRA